MAIFQRQEGTRTLDMRPFGYLATIPATISTFDSANITNKTQITIIND